VTDPSPSSGKRPFVTVIIPALQEADDISECIERIGAQTYPLERVEVIVVDGVSSDATVREASRAAERSLFARFVVVTNPRRRTSTSLNVGLAEARGEIVVRIDARARVQPDYIEVVVDRLVGDPTTGVVGGSQVPTARSGAFVDRSIARGLRNRFATGMSRYRRSTESGAADTVWMGTFRTDELRALGGWDDSVALNEDWELNARYRQAGQVVWYAAELRSRYLPRSTFGRLARQYFSFGRVKGMWWVRGMRPGPRQLVLVLAPVVGAGILGVAIRRLGPKAALVVPVALLVVDAVGAPEPADDGAERLGSAAAMALYTGGWWVGVVVGAAGEALGVEHRHRSLPS
jgi:succinoglycan biosynthesis protein ExoA